MKIKTFKIRFPTKGYASIYDVTDQANEKLEQTRIQEGQAHFFVVGSTAGITTVEYEPGLLKDLQEFFEKIIPQNQYYHHEETWHDGNGFSHIRASLLKPSLTVPISGGKMTLGTWQQIIVIDFDNRSRNREVVLQIVGL